MSQVATLGAPPTECDSDLVADAAMYRLMIENTIDIIVRYDASRRRTYISPSAREVLGYDPLEMLDLHPSQIIHPDDFPKMHPVFATLGPSCPRLQLTFRMRHKNGAYVWIEGQYRCLPGDGGYLSMLRDVTARTEAEAKLTEANRKLATLNRALQVLAEQDGLTGLVNRRHFNTLLDREFRRATREQATLSLLMLDVDCFKAYNDRYGHLAGDECLRRIGRAIQDVPRRPGDEAARFGGEEFAVLLPATPDTDAVAIAERVRQAIMAMHVEHLDSPTGVVTVSVGVGSLTPWLFGDEPASLIEAADRALYRAKSGGRNRVEILPACLPRGG